MTLNAVPLQGLTNLSASTFEAWPYPRSSSLMCLRMGTRTLMLYDLEDRVLLHSLFAPSHLDFTSGLIDGCVVLNHKHLLEHVDLQEKKDPEWDECKKLDHLSIQHLVLDSSGQVLCVSPNGQVYTWQGLISNNFETSTSDLAKKVVGCRALESNNTSYLLLRFEDKSYSLFTVSLDAADVSLRVVEEGKSDWVDLLNINNDLGLVTVNNDKLVIKSKGDNAHPMVLDVLDGNKVSFLKALNENYVVVVTEDDNEKSRLIIVHCVFGLVVKSIEFKKRVQGLEVVLSKLLLLINNKMQMIDVSVLPRDVDELMSWQSLQGKSIGKDDENSEAVNLFGLVPDAIKTKDMDAITELISKAKDVPEVLVARILKFLLEDEDNEDRKHVLKREKLWLRVLQIPITPSIMSNHMATLGLDAVMTLIEQLGQALKLCLCESKSSQNLLVDSLLQWVDLVLNSHYCALLLSKRKGALQKLESLLLCISQLERGASICVTLLPFINSIQQRQKIVAAAARQDLENAISAENALYVIEPIFL